MTSEMPLRRPITIAIGRKHDRRHVMRENRKKLRIMPTTQRPNASSSVWHSVRVAVDISPLKIRRYLVSRGSITNRSRMTTPPPPSPSHGFSERQRKHLISSTDVPILIRRISITGRAGVEQRSPLKRSPHPFVMTQSLLPPVVASPSSSFAHPPPPPTTSIIPNRSFSRPAFRAPCFVVALLLTYMQLIGASSKAEPATGKTRQLLNLYSMIAPGWLPQ